MLLGVVDLHDSTAGGVDFENQSPAACSRGFSDVGCTDLKLEILAAFRKFWEGRSVPNAAAAKLPKAWTWSRST
jgi:hypothetical protein